MIILAKTKMITLKVIDCNYIGMEELYHTLSLRNDSALLFAGEDNQVSDLEVPSLKLSS